MGNMGNKMWVNKDNQFQVKFQTKARFPIQRCLILGVGGDSKLRNQFQNPAKKCRILNKGRSNCRGSN